MKTLKPLPRARSGFSLVELLATLVLMSLVFLLLFRGFQAVSDAMIRGGRQSGLDRELHTALNLMREDLEQMRVTPQTPFAAQIVSSEDTYAVLSFLRVQNQADPLYDRESVQYWIEAHVERPYLRQLVRYAAPNDDNFHDPEDAGFMSGHAEDLREHPEVTGEIIIDHLIELQLHFPTPSEGGIVTLRTRGGSERHDRTEAPRWFDIALGLSRDPLPRLAVERNPGQNFYRDVEMLDGTWGRVRAQPRLHAPPEIPEETP